MEVRGGSTHAAPRARIAAGLALVAALGVAAYGIVKNTRAVGGSDSSCYGLMAAAFAQGQWQPSFDLAKAAPWPDAARTLAPAGFVPSTVRDGAASPVCAAGFSIVLAPFVWLDGRDGIFVVSPLAGAALVWLTFVVARQFAGPAAGVASAFVVATIPVLLFQVVQPMNDVLVAAIWMAVIAAAALPEPSRAWVLGGLTGLAVLIRPNLAPSAVVVAGWLAAVTIRQHGRTKMLVRTALGFALASAPFVALLLVLNAVLYGHPLQSGYGQLGELFASENISVNASHYAAALWETQLAFPLIGVLALVVAPRHTGPAIWLAGLVSASIAVVYLFYRPFPEWWYLRFFLPSLAIMTALACATVAWVLAKVTDRRSTAAAVAVMVVAIAISGVQVRVARERRVADLQRLERRFRTTGEVVRERLPSNAVFIAVWQSGTLRYHASREAILWDAMAPDSLDRAIDWLNARGLEPFLLLEDWEGPLFRERFRGRSAMGELDWPPRFEIERQVRIYRPADRSLFHGGGQIPTEFVMPR